MILSVVVPAYNVEKYIERCIESILKQTNCEFELIIVDDGSTDRTLELAKKYESNCVSVLTQKNQGSGIARNKGLSIAKGDYVYFVDPDDIVVPGMFENVFYQLNGCTFDIIQFSYSFTSESGDIWNQSKKLTPRYECDTNQKIIDSLTLMLNETNIYTVWSKFINRHFLTKNNILFTKQKTGQDALFIIEILKNAETLIWLPERNYLYLVDRNGSAQNKKDYNTIKDDNNILSSLYELEVEKKMSSEIFSDFAIYVLEKELRYIGTENEAYPIFNLTLNQSVLNEKIAKVSIKRVSWKKKLFFLARKYCHPLSYLYYRRINLSGK